MALGRIKVWSSGELVANTDLNTEFNNLISGILAVDPGAASSITPSQLANGANPQVFFAELFVDGAVVSDTDFIYLSKTGLTVTISAGTAYVLQTSSDPAKLVRVNIAQSTTHTVLDNTTNYLDLGADGTIDVTQSATAATDHTRLLEVIASGGAITGTPTDLADRSFLDDTIAAFKPKKRVWRVASTTTIVIDAGTRFRDTTNTKDFEFATDQTIDITGSVGANALDQGTEGASKWYAVVGIGDSSGILATKGLLVEAANYTGAIILPTGYDMYDRLGWARNDGSSNLLLGEYFHNRFHYDEEQVAGTGLTSTSFAATSLASFIPPTEREADLRIDWSTHSGSGTANLRMTGSSSSTGVIMLGSVDQRNVFSFLTDESQSIDYKVSGNALDIAVIGYMDDTEQES